MLFDNEISDFEECMIKQIFIVFIEITQQDLSLQLNHSMNIRLPVYIYDNITLKKIFKH